MSDDRKMAIYSDYLDALRDLCNRTGVPFRLADRVLYAFDRYHNGTL